MTCDDELRALREEVAKLRRELHAANATSDCLAEAERIVGLGSWSWERSTNEVYWSQQLRRILGYSDEEPATVDGFFARIHPEDLERVLASAEEASNQAGFVSETRFRVVRQDGTTRRVRMNGANTFDDEGQPLRAVGTIVDITRDFEEAAERDRLLYTLTAALKLTKTVAFSWSPGLDLFEGEHLEACLGFPVSSTATLLDQVPASDRERIRTALQDAARLGVLESTTFSVSGRYGARFFELRGRGSPRRIHGAIADVTERRHMEQRLLEHQKMQAIAQLAGGIAHDFNNLLTVIRANLEEVDAESSGLRDAAKAAEQASRLTSRLLAFGRRAVVQPEYFDLNEGVDQAAPMLRTALRSNIELVADFEPLGTPIHFDRTQLEQVLLNVCFNAAEAMPYGGRLTLRTRRITRQGINYSVLEVADTGIGMSPEVAKRAFEPYFTTKPIGDGTGLGLAMVIGALEQADGKVELHSEQGNGTSLRLFFPARESQKRTRSSSRNLKAIRPCRVLLVEDEPAVARVVARLLRRHRFEVHVCTHPSDALAIDDEVLRSCELALLDVVMPECQGPDLARQLQARHPELKVLFVTGYAENLDLDALAPAFVLPKPFREDELLSAISNTMDLSQELETA